MGIDARQLEYFARQGDAAAQCALGTSYANGDGVPQDFEKAKEWWEMAAAAGDATAKKNLEILKKNEGI